MKQIIMSMITDARNDLHEMEKSKMSLKNRIAYEKAILRLKTINDLLYKCGKLENPSN